ncbi:MAG: recombinase family protein [Oscillospiraceae bacterium]|nr:recombinase family protein [Oscillospiraceae bacterium]
MKDIKIAAAYIRVSTDEQAELSPDSQLAVVRSYAEKNGYILPEEYIFTDEGISGRTAKKRPAFNEMIALAKSTDHPVDAILVWKFSRFARNQEESIVYKAMLKKDKVDVVSVSEPLIEGPFGSLIERIIEWMDEYYSIRLSGEVKRSMTVNAQRGQRQSIPPFGYTLEPPRADGKQRDMIPLPEEAALVREIFARFVGGEGLFPIAKWLNSVGARTHRGGAFENRTVEYILCNPTYVGKLRWTPTGRTRRDFHNPDTIVMDGTHEPIIDEAVWEAAQKRIQAVKEQWGYKARPTYELKDWLGGIVRCAECGGTLVFTKPHYFKCNNYVRGRCHSTQHIKTELLHEAIIAKLEADSESAAPLHYALAVGSADKAEERKRLLAAEEQLDRKLKRIREAYTAGIDSLEDYGRYKAEIDAEREHLRSRISELEAHDPGKAEDSLRENIRKTVETLRSPDTTKEQKNNAAREILESCVFDKATMTLKITYRLTI